MAGRQPQPQVHHHRPRRVHDPPGRPPRIPHRPRVEHLFECASGRSSACPPPPGSMPLLATRRRLRGRGVPPPPPARPAHAGGGAPAPPLPRRRPRPLGRASTTPLTSRDVDGAADAPSPRRPEANPATPGTAPGQPHHGPRPHPGPARSPPPPADHRAACTRSHRVPAGSGSDRPARYPAARMTLGPEYDPRRPPRTAAPSQCCWSPPRRLSVPPTPRVWPVARAGPRAGCGRWGGGEPPVSSRSARRALATPTRRR